MDGHFPDRRDSRVIGLTAMWGRGWEREPGSRRVGDEEWARRPAVTPVPSLTDAVRLANASPYVLGSAVFTKRRGAGMRAARALRARVTSVNSAATRGTRPGS